MGRPTKRQRGNGKPAILRPTRMQRPPILGHRSFFLSIQFNSMGRPKKRQRGNGNRTVERPTRRQRGNENRAVQRHTKDDDCGSKLEHNKIRPQQGIYPDAVGLDKPRDDVIELLNLEGQSKVKMVVVYGIGGIGKTTVSTAVYNTLNLGGYKYCRVVMEQDCSTSYIKSLQKQILKDLFDKDLELRDHVEGREHLSEAFRRETNQPLFIFIDNALKGSDLAMLLPELSFLPVQSRILITTRKLDETDIVWHSHIERCSYLVQPLRSLEAKKILCKKALGSVHESFSIDTDIDGLVECCGGIPLVLELVGSKLRSGGSKVSLVNSLKRTLREGEGELSKKVVDCVYDSLPDSYKEAFLDVASFFQNESRDFVAKVVGELEMKGLEDAALVKTSDDGVTMHDIVRALGKSLSKSNRITDIASLLDVFQDKQVSNTGQPSGAEGHIINCNIGDVKYNRAVGDININPKLNTILNTGHPDVLGDRQKLRQLKGIMLLVDDVDKHEELTGELEGIKIKAESLDLASETLRILQLQGYCEVEGQCMMPFENLRLLDVWSICDNTCFSMRRNNLKRLAVCDSGLSTNDNDFQRSESLIKLDLNLLSTVPDSLLDCSSLEELTLWDCTIVSLPQSLGRLRFLRILKLNYCKQLTTLPESLGDLSSLKILYLFCCGQLKGLPQSVCQLSSLEQLIMPRCQRFSKLPEKFGELKSLKILIVNNCRNLMNLSEDFGRLTSLAVMNASGCSNLEEKAMDTLVELKSLKFLNIAGSPMLGARWEQIKEHHPLLVYSTLEDWVFWERQFSKMTSWEFFHLGRGLMQLDGLGNLKKWIPSRSSVDGQAKVGVLFTMSDLSAPSNSEALQTVKEKCTELLCQDFHIIYIQVGLRENEQLICQTLLKLPGTIAWIPYVYRGMSLFFEYCAHRTLQNGGFKDKKRAFFCKENQHVELTLALDALNTFLIEVKPVDDFDRPPGRSEQRGRFHALLSNFPEHEWFLRVKELQSFWVEFFCGVESFPYIS